MFYHNDSKFKLFLLEYTLELQRLNVYDHETMLDFHWKAMCWKEEEDDDISMGKKLISNILNTNLMFTKVVYYK